MFTPKLVTTWDIWRFRFQGFGVGILLGLVGLYGQHFLAEEKLGQCLLAQRAYASEYEALNGAPSLVCKIWGDPREDTTYWHECYAGKFVIRPEKWKLP